MEKQPKKVTATKNPVMAVKKPNINSWYKYIHREVNRLKSVKN